MDHKDPILYEIAPFRWQAVFRVVNFRCTGNINPQELYAGLLYGGKEVLLPAATMSAVGNYIANPIDFRMRCVSIG